MCDTLTRLHIKFPYSETILFLFFLIFYIYQIYFLIKLQIAFFGILVLLLEIRKGNDSDLIRINFFEFSIIMRQDFKNFCKLNVLYQLI